MSGHPLAVGAGAGSLSSLVIALLSQHLQQSPPTYGPPGIIEGPSRFESPFELPPIFWILDRLAGWGAHWDPHIFIA